LPETRCIFEEITRPDGEALRVRVSRGDGFATPVRMKGASRTRRREWTVDRTIEGPETTLEIAPDTEALALCLVTPDGSVLDTHFEDLDDLDGRRRVLFGGSTDSPDAADIEEAVARGEGDRTEFKPLRPPSVKDPGAQVHEILESVCAFANTAGGDVLLGVSDHGEIVGVPTDRVADVERFLLELRERIRSGIHPTPEVEDSIIEVGGVLLVRLRVMESEDKPLQGVQTHEFLVRRGATDRKPSRDELAAMFQRDDEGAPRTLGPM
jgi:ATP-dependent DNA helicase RecG